VSQLPGEIAILDLENEIERFAGGAPSSAPFAFRQENLKTQRTRRRVAEGIAFLGGAPNKAVLLAWLRMKPASKGV
jgi:hypothetical protein